LVWAERFELSITDFTQLLAPCIEKTKLRLL
jgi:hypothetical protein